MMVKAKRRCYFFLFLKQTSQNIQLCVICVLFCFYYLLLDDCTAEDEHTTR